MAQGQPIKAVHIQELRNRVTDAWSTGSSLQINWLVADQLGTPRMIFDKTGTLTNMKRHDYLPFGEELGSNVGLRTVTSGYSADNTRQKFTQYERDNESGLDYAHARYYSNIGNLKNIGNIFRNVGDVLRRNDASKYGSS